MPKKEKKIKNKIKNKNKNKNINKIIINVNSNNKRKTVQHKKESTQQSIPYVINPSQTPIIYQQPVQPVQNDYGIGFNRLLDGLSNRLDTLQQENQHLKTNSLLEAQKRHDYIENLQEQQRQAEPLNYEKLNKEWDTMSDISNRSNDNNYSTSNPIMTGNLSLHDYRHGNNLYPFSRIDT